MAASIFVIYNLFHIFLLELNQCAWLKDPIYLRFITVLGTMDHKRKLKH